MVSLDEWLVAAEEALAYDDSWEGLEHYVMTALSFGPGSLATIAGTIEVTKEMAEKNKRSDDTVDALVTRARAAGVLRADVIAIDLHLLIEQLGRSPLLEQLDRQGRAELVEAAAIARARVVAIALDGPRAPAPRPLPGRAPGYELFSQRWARPV